MEMYLQEDLVEKTLVLSLQEITFMTRFIDVVYILDVAIEWYLGW